MHNPILNNTTVFICIICTLLFSNTTSPQTLPVGKDTVLTQRQKDRVFLQRAGADQVAKFKKAFAKTWDRVFVDFTDNEVLLLAGMNFAKQNIRANGYTSPFVYEVEQKNVYKPGFMAGFRVDGKYKEKHPYAFAFSLNRFAAGAHYKEVKTLDPFIGSFSNFKATEQLFTLDMTALYKKIIPITDTAKYKFYVVAGPSLAMRLSGQSLDNQVNNHYRKLFLSAQLGLEFNNNDYYTIFFHYKQGLHSITRSSIQTGFNNFELGMLIRASDLF